MQIVKAKEVKFIEKAMITPSVRIAFEDFLKAQHVPVRRFKDVSEYETHLSSL